MEKNYLEKMEESIMNNIISEDKGCVYVIPTGGGKTYTGILKICKNLSFSDKKIINVILNPFDVLRSRIKFDLNRLGLNVYTKDEFCIANNNSNLILVNDTWSSFIMEDSYKKDGDNPSFLEKINSFKKKGYVVIFTIDETHIFSTLELKKAPKAKEFINDISPTTQIHFSATPGNVFDMGLNMFRVTGEEVVQLGFVKKEIIIEESESPFRRIDVSIDEYESICSLYEKLGIKTNPKYMLVLPTKTKKNDSYDEYLSYFKKKIESKGYDKNSIYHLDVHGKEQNIELVNDMSILDGDKTEIRFLITIHSGLTGLDVHSLEVGCVMSNLNETQQIQLTGRFVRNLNQETHQVYPKIFVSHTQSFTCFGGYDEQIKNIQYTLSEDIETKFPTAIVSNKYVNTTSIISCFEENISTIQLVNSGYEEKNGSESVKYERLVGTGETINPNAYTTVNEMDLNTCRSKVKSSLNVLDISESENYKILTILKNHYRFSSYEEMFISISQYKNISEISRILDICKNKILENRKVDQKIDYGVIKLPKQFRVPKGKFSTFTCDGIYAGDLQFDEDGERMCFILLTKKGYKVFRNHGLIKIPYLMDGKYYTYEPDFIGFDLDNKISALDRKGKSVPIDQKKSIPFKSEAAEKLGYSHYIVTEDSTLNKNNVYLWNKSDEFKSYNESPQDWTTIKSI